MGFIQIKCSNANYRKKDSLISQTSKSKKFKRYRNRNSSYSTKKMLFSSNAKVHEVFHITHILNSKQPLERMREIKFNTKLILLNHP